MSEELKKYTVDYSYRVTGEVSVMAVSKKAAEQSARLLVAARDGIDAEEVGVYNAIESDYWD